MKKTFWGLAALMLMAAPMMTSCSNDLDEVAPVEEEKSNVVTITIAPPAAEPETRVAMGGENGLTIAGWEIGDVVTLYKATKGQWYDDIPPKIIGTGVAFTCTNTSAGTFSGTLPDGENIDDYNVAIFGGTAEYVEFKNDWGYIESTKIQITPTTWSSTDLKDVVMMGAAREEGESSFTMEIINNVMKIKNQSGADVEVAWYGYDSYYGGHNSYFELATVLALGNYDAWEWFGNYINHFNLEYPTFEEVPHFTLVNNSDNYVNFPLILGYEGDEIGLYKSDGTAVVPMKSIKRSLQNEGHFLYCGHLFNAGTYSGTAN